MIMEESIWKWRKKMLCNVIWKGKGIGMKGKMLKEVQFVDDEHEKFFLDNIVRCRYEGGVSSCPNILSGELARLREGI